jgi:dolichol-phosphate mannosyltransferase
MAGWRRALSRLGNLYARLIAGLTVHDATAGFRAYRAEALERIEVGETRSDGYAFLVELAWRCERAGLRVCEHPICFAERASGGSKLGLRVIAEAAWRPWQMRMSRYGRARRPR